jgi:hypothetical protein
MGPEDRIEKHSSLSNMRVDRVVECTNDAVVDDLGECSLFPSETVKVESQTLKQTLGAEQQQAVTKRLVCREVETHNTSNRFTVMLLLGTRLGLTVVR